MPNIWQTLNNREWAVLIWGAILLVYGSAAARSSVKSLLKSFFHWKVIGIFISLAAYSIATIYVLWRLKFWDLALLKDTVVWFLTVACVAIFEAISGAESKSMFHKLVISSLALMAFLSFVVDSFVLPFYWEMVLVPFLSIIAMMSILANYKKEYKTVRRPLQAVMNLAGLLMLAWALHQLYLSLPQFATWSTVKEFLLTPVLSMCAIPFFFALALIAAYETLFIRFDCFLKDRPELVRHAKWRAIISANISLRRISKLSGPFICELQEAADREAVTQVIRTFAFAPDPQKLTGEVIQTRIVSYRMPCNGQRVQKILVNWKNTSDSSVVAAYADITVFDKDGDELLPGVKKHCIFSYDGTEEGKVKPGQVFIEPEETGYIWPSNAFGVAEQAEAKIVKLLDRW